MAIWRTAHRVVSIDARILSAFAPDRSVVVSSVGSLRILAVGTALCGLVATGSGCFLFNHGKAAPAPVATFDVPAGEIALSVTNHNYLDVVIYVLHDGQQTRIGTVTGSSSQVFYLRARLLGMGREIRLLGHPIGGQDLARTETIVVQPGQYIEWTLETDLRRSSVGVY